MKKILLTTCIMGIASLSTFAQSADSTHYTIFSKGDLFKGLSKTIPNGRVILPYGLEVTYDKTTHLIFPAPIRYVDLGSSNIIAGKADDAENVLRVKAAYKDFETETNMSVICNDGSFYVFNIHYTDEPEKLSIEMQDFNSSEGRLPSNKSEVYFKELGRESPLLANLIMKTIYQNNKRHIRHVGAKAFGIRFLLNGIYSHNGILYLQTEIYNNSNMPYPIDFLSFKIVDKKTAKQTAMQEKVLQPLRTYHQVMEIQPDKKQRTIYALEQFSLAEDKQLEVTLYEKNGSRTLTFYLQADDLLLTKNINNLKLKWK